MAQELKVYIESAQMKKLLKGLLDTQTEIKEITSEPKSLGPNEVFVIDFDTYFKFYRAHESIESATKESILHGSDASKASQLNDKDATNKLVSNLRLEDRKLKFTSPTGEKEIEFPVATSDQAGVITEDKVKQLAASKVAEGVPDASDDQAGKISKNDVRALVSAGITGKVDQTVADKSYYTDALLRDNNLVLRTKNGTEKTVALDKFYNTLKIPDNLFKNAVVRSNNLVFTKQDGEELVVNMDHFVDKVPLAAESTAGTITEARVKELAKSTIDGSVGSSGTLKNKLDDMAGKTEAAQNKADAADTKADDAVKTVAVDGNNLKVTTGKGAVTNIPLSDIAKHVSDDTTPGTISKNEVKGLVDEKLGNKLENAITGGSYAKETHTITLTRNSNSSPVTLDLSELAMRPAKNSDLFQ